MNDVHHDAFMIKAEKYDTMIAMTKHTMYKFIFYGLMEILNGTNNKLKDAEKNGLGADERDDLKSRSFAIAKSINHENIIRTVTAMKMYIELYLRKPDVKYY